MSKKNITIQGVITIIVVIILIVAGIQYINFNGDDEKEEPIEKKEIDNNISPLVNQGLTLEVKRIRHRGLYEKLITPGNAWKTNPKFYFISNMDGLEYISRDVTQHGKIIEVYFESWDTIFQENKIVKDAEEEQVTSTVSLQIVEVFKSGLFGRKTQDIVSDGFTVTYDYRTGRWDGKDDSFMDSDGYGHYLGETFEIWFNIYQVDYDDDYIPYWTEVNVLGTDPLVDDSEEDPDNDGIPTDWEWRWGYDPHVWDDHERLDPDVDGLENVEEYEMEKYFADPYSQNVFVEVDFMEGTGLLDPPHIFPTECQQAIIEKYAEHNIRLLFDDGWSDHLVNGGGEFVDHIYKVSQDSGMISQYYYHHFPEERRGVFRYLLIGHDGGFNHPSIGNVYDSTYVPDMIIEEPLRSIQKFINLGSYPTKRGQYSALASVVMHEFGHSVGLSKVYFGGIDNVSYGIWFYPAKDYGWTDYRSVMNYQCMYDPNLIDYSDGSNGAPYDQNDWMEIFVPTFQYNKNYIEDPAGYSDVINSEERFPAGYSFDESLTDMFVSGLNSYSPVAPIEVEWKVFQTDENSDLRDIKVFVKPRVNSGKWVLYQEGDIDSKGEMQFYSQEELFNQLPDWDNIES